MNSRDIFFTNQYWFFVYVKYSKFESIFPPQKCLIREPTVRVCVLLSFADRPPQGLREGELEPDVPRLRHPGGQGQGQAQGQEQERVRKVPGDIIWHMRKPITFPFFSQIYGKLLAIIRKKVILLNEPFYGGNLHCSSIF